MVRAILAVLALACSVLAAEAASKNPIRLARGPEVEQQLMAEIAASALRKSGFKVQVVDLDTPDAARAVADATVHVHPALIRANGAEALDRALADAAAVSLGGIRSNAPDEPVMKVVWSGMKSKWAYAQKMLKRIIVSAADMEAMKQAVADGAAPDAAAQAWWKANAKTWKPWIAASKNWMKP